MLFKKFFVIYFLFFSLSVSAAKINKIRHITIHGVQNISPNNIVKIFSSNSFHDNRSGDISSKIKYLFSTKIFNKINASQFRDTLIISVKEFPLIDKISIYGNKNISDQDFNKLLKKFSLQEKNHFNTFNFKNFFYFLRKKYERKGYCNIHCNLMKIQLPNNKLHLKIMINEGFESSVSHIFIKGNNYFSRIKLLKNVSIYNNSLLWNFFLSHKYNHYEFKQLLYDLHNFYINNGYFDFKIGKIKKYLSKNRKDIYIKINIHEGTQYKIKKIFMNKFSKEYNYKKIHHVIYSLLNSYYNKHTVDHIKEKVKNNFLQEGLLNCDVFFHIDIDKKDKQVFLYFVSDLKEKYFINKISYNGNANIQNNFINRFIRKGKNNVFDINIIKKYCKNLFNTGLFHTIKVYAQKKVGSDNLVNIHHIFNENNNTRDINISTTVEKERGLLLKLLFLEKNLIGTGAELYIKILKNFSDTNINIFLLKPLGLLKNFFLKSDIFFNSFKKKYVSSSNSFNKICGFYTSIKTPYIKNKKFSISYGYEKTQILNNILHFSLIQYLLSFPKDFFLNYKINNFFVNDFFIKYMFDFNNIKEKDFFKMGMHIKFLGKLILPFSDNFYHKIFFCLNQYVPLESMYNILLHNYMEFGTGLTLNKHIIPFYENYKFYKKKIHSGFNDNSVGPTAVYYRNNINKNTNNQNQIQSHFFPSSEFIGGDMMLHANTELLFPNLKILKKFFKSCQGGIFIDAINIWNTKWKNRTFLYSIKHALNFNDPSQIHLSIGTFFHCQSFFGPITFTFALPVYPFNVSNHCVSRFSLDFK
ncbi:Outer membrane protein assembly factor BamA [Buchnera aphidicola (Cinara piceae)]|uniref:Outer membrane protein assembly factor BamA n=1 Tax=Buchnera aphidicola (Cinara piceae) TaxID=1660043 RepID=A0A803FTQ2_9GAMM|nr:outer membrane protein assembly factor BamA [Buchnera aphidicola]VFP88192.1 Outer membrane protein assembly factor BamA [Buchnera aphidicola (Cinara piceae)]